MNNKTVKNLFEQTQDLLDQSLAISSPNKLVMNCVEFNDANLVINNEEIKNYNNIYVIGFGKASLKMFQGLFEVLGSKCIEKALLVTHIDNHNLCFPKTEIIISSHPFITDKSERAAKKIMDFIETINSDDLLIVLVSGGGSAMLSLPIDQLTLNEKVDYISRILVAGIPEREANEIKKSLSKIKGGGISENAGCSQIVNLFLSDERNHKFDAIASGPSTEKISVDSYQIIKKYDLEGITPNNIKEMIRNHSRQKKKISKKKEIKNFLIGSRENLLQSLSSCAPNFNFKKVHILENLSEINTEEAARYLSNNYKKIYETSPKGMNLVLSSGEIQVQIPNTETAKGGRNQHLVAVMMQKYQFEFPFTFLAYATDGMDFLEGVTGAYYTDNHLKLIKQKLNYVMEAIKNNQTYNLHKSFKTLLKGEKTGNNVSDVYLFSFFKD